MKGRVTAELLNIRSLPSLSARKIGVLTKDTVVSIINEQASWLEISFQNQSAYISGEFVLHLESEVNLTGRVKAALLNVRREPSLHSDVMGSLILDSRIDVLDENGEWLEIAFNNRSGYVHQDFVEVFETRIDDVAVVAVDRLNVRSRPDASANLLGVLERDARVKILSQTGKWCEIKFNEITAYIHSDYIERGDSKQAPSTQVVTPSDKQTAIVAEGDLKPAEKLPLTGSQIDKKVARTWNNFGGLLADMSGAYKIDQGLPLPFFVLKVRVKVLNHKTKIG